MIFSKLAVNCVIWYWFVSRFVTVLQHVTAVYTLTPYIQRHSGYRSYSQRFVFFLAGVGRGQDVRSIMRGRIVSPQLGFQPHPLTAQLHQMLTAEVSSGDLQLLLDQRITQALKASKHHAHSIPFGSMSTGEFEFLNTFHRCCSHTQLPSSIYINVLQQLLSHILAWTLCRGTGD